MVSLHERLDKHATVCGVILNDRASLEAIQPQLDQPPYNKPPVAPVMYVKPANTWTHDGAVIELPQGANDLEVGTTVGIMIGRDASCVAVADAMSHVQGYVLAADLSVPHSSYFRPAIQEKSFDDSCVFGEVLSATAISDISQVSMTTWIDGKEVERRSLDDLIRDVPTLISDVSQFMTLRRGDVLLIGVKYQAATAGPNNTVTVSSSHFSDLRFTITAMQGETQ